MMKNFLVRLITALVFICYAFGSTALAQTPSTPANNSVQLPKKSNERPAASAATKPEPFDGATVEKMAAQCVTLETEAGSILIEMLAETAPETARNFLNLAATGAFDTTTFNRTVKGFVIQGGHLATRPSLTPELAARSARSLVDEPNPVKHVRGIVSMARSDQPNSAKTSFFILVGDGSHLDGKFAAFGRVLSGMDVVDAINQASAEGDKPSKPVRLTRALVAPCPATSAQ